MKLKHRLGKAFLVTRIVLIAAFPIFAQEPAISDGVAWLEANQDTSGLWGTDTQTPFGDATAVADVLSCLNGACIL